jgi:hypothetical protein
MGWEKDHADKLRERGDEVDEDQAEERPELVPESNRWPELQSHS